MKRQFEIQNRENKENKYFNNNNEAKAPTQATSEELLPAINYLICEAINNNKISFAKNLITEYPFAVDFSCKPKPGGKTIFAHFVLNSDFDFLEKISTPIYAFSRFNSDDIKKLKTALGAKLANLTEYNYKTTVLSDQDLVGLLQDIKMLNEDLKNFFLEKIEQVPTISKTIAQLDLNEKIEAEDFGPISVFLYLALTGNFGFLRKLEKNLIYLKVDLNEKISFFHDQGITLAWFLALEDQHQLLLDLSSKCETPVDLSASPTLSTHEYFGVQLAWLLFDRNRPSLVFELYDRRSPIPNLNALPSCKNIIISDLQHNKGVTLGWFITQYLSGDYYHEAIAMLDHWSENQQIDFNVMPESGEHEDSNVTAGWFLIQEMILHMDQLTLFHKLITKANLPLMLEDEPDGIDYEPESLLWKLVHNNLVDTFYLIIKAHNPSNALSYIEQVWSTKETDNGIEIGFENFIKNVLIKAEDNFDFLIKIFNNLSCDKYQRLYYLTSLSVLRVYNRQIQISLDYVLKATSSITITDLNDIITTFETMIPLVNSLLNSNAIPTICAEALSIIAMFIFNELIPLTEKNLVENKLQQVIITKCLEAIINNLPNNIISSTDLTSLNSDKDKLNLCGEYLLLESIARDGNNLHTKEFAKIHVKYNKEQHKLDKVQEENKLLQEQIKLMQATIEALQKQINTKSKEPNSFSSGSTFFNSPKSTESDSNNLPANQFN